MTEDVLVIGAGPAGIASAYYLKQAGISYRVVDRAPVIASTWNSLYPSLRLNTTRFYSHLPGKRFPLRFGLFPTAKQYHRYLADFVREHELNIELGVNVEYAYPHELGWSVVMDGETHWFPALISATGRFGAPYEPHFPGRETFQGTVIHAKNYHGPAPFYNRRVMVVGNGPSGVDIATELGPIARRPVLLSQRTGVILRPRYPWGLPKHIWMMIADLLPDRLGQPLLRRVFDLQFEHLDRIGLKVPRTEAESTAAAGTRGKELILAVKAGRVRSVDGPARFDGSDVVLTDGSRHTVDAVILATGYHPVLYQYLDLDAVTTNRDGWPMRVGEKPDDVTSGKRRVAGFPGLYLVGTFYQGKGAMYNFNVEAKAAVAEIKPRLAALEASAARHSFGILR